LKYIFIILFFISSLKAETFKVSSKLLTFENKDGLLLFGCTENCIALKKIKEFKKINLEKARKDIKFNGSIGSDVCKLIYLGESLLGTMENKDQRAFCVFSDSSMIETNSLSNYLKSHSIVSEDI
jgi:hypothetical protein